MWNARTIALALAATLAASAPVGVAAAPRPAAGPTPLPGAPRLSPDLSLYLQRVRFERRGALPTALTVVIAFDHAPAPELLRRLEDAGVAFRHLPGHTERAHVGRFYGARVAVPGGLDLLAHEPTVRQLLPAFPPVVPPLPFPSQRGKVHTLTHADRTWPLRDPQGRRVAGRGVVICDIDDGVDLYHPFFFRPDGGLYPWIDVNGDGAMTPGVDAVDLNGDGEAGPDETLSLLESGFTDYYGQGVTDIDGQFTPRRDYLYVDQDGNGRRSAGPSDGFGEDDPAYGEPIFLADDVDGDRALGLHEKLLRLGTSKLRGVYRGASNQYYQRGVNLYEHVFTDGPHGTGVAGILVGGALGRTDVQGVAPEAELLTVSLPQSGFEGGAEGDLATAFAWVESMQANHCIHEYGSHFAMYADGGSEWEALLDEATGRGYPQVTATHNFAGYGGHAAGTLAPGDSADLPLQIQPWGGQTGAGSQYLMVTLRWRRPNRGPAAAGDTMTLALIPPGGEPLSVGSEGFQGDYYLMPSGGLSDRGTGMVAAYVARMVNDAQVALPSGLWTVRVANQSASTEAVPLDWQLSLSDETGYAYATNLQADVTDDGTIAHPSTADTAISVGASVGNTVGPGEVASGLKVFSGRGPRIDGARGVDVVAPEDHFSAATTNPVGGSADYIQFGGTSGALPQVGGAVALLLQVAPDLTPQEVAVRVRESAGADALTGEIPNTRWGFGRLDTYALVAGALGRPASVPPNSPPSLAFAHANTLYTKTPTPLDLGGSSDEETPAGALTYRWDVDYDGVWDHEATGEPVFEATFPAPGDYDVKVAVEDEQGFSTAKVFPVTVVEGPPPAPDPGPEAAPDAAPDAGSAPDTDTEAADAAGPDGASPDAPPTATPGSGGGGCATAPGGRSGGAAALLALALLGWLVTRRRG